ncbi:uncharacterized protein ACN2A1_006203 [Glossina fuscipes fuscipes]
MKAKFVFLFFIFLLVFLLITTAYKDPLCVRREDKKLGDTEGHYTAHIGVATNDPCTIPGPEGANYYLKWNHGKLLGAVERPTYKKYTYCFESVIYNQLGYYLWIPPKSVKKGMCVHPSGNYVWYHGPLPKGKQVKGYVAPKTSTLLDFVFPNNNKTMKSIFGLIPPLAEDYTETPKPVTMSPQPGIYKLCFVYVFVLCLIYTSLHVKTTDYKNWQRDR